MIRRIAWTGSDRSRRNIFMRDRSASKRIPQGPQARRASFYLQVFGLAALCTNACSTARGQSPHAAESPPKGALLIAGGGLRYDNADVWTRYVKLADNYARETGAADGKRPRIAVFPTAAFYPQQSGARVVAAIQ